MAANLLHTADFLRDELQTYFHIIRRGGEDGAKAAARLRTALRQVESLLPPGAVNQVDLALEQRWGYVQLISLIDTARHELHRAER
jgi:hypothetical protein